MDIITITVIAFGLAIDCFSVSIANGMARSLSGVSNALKIATSFGLFQTTMLTAGWASGLGLSSIISGVDHWVAFGLLSLVGGKMIYESTRNRSAEKEIKPLNLSVLLLLSIATSIDSFGVGVSFAFLKTSIIIPVIVVGAVSFLLSFAGVFIGEASGRIFENKIEIVGGLILIGIGIKILMEHLLPI